MHDSSVDALHNIVGLLVFLPPTRALLKRFLPKSGEGPSEKIQQQGYFHIGLWGRGRAVTGEETVVFGGVSAVGGDPGYRQTAKMVCEAALCLACDEEKLPKSYGILTPSIAFGDTYMERLRAAGMEFFVQK